MPLTFLSNSVRIIYFSFFFILFHSFSLFLFVFVSLCFLLLSSEDNRSSGNAAGARMQESANINRSLFVLGNVISSLNAGQTRVPYRDSKLTRLLQDSLGGSSNALMICNIAPGIRFQLFTARTLEFATNGRKIINRVQTHQEDIPEPVEHYRGPMSLFSSSASASSLVSQSSLSSSSSSSSSSPPSSTSALGLGADASLSSMSKEEIMQLKLRLWKTEKERERQRKEGKGAAKRLGALAECAGKPSRPGSAVAASASAKGVVNGVASISESLLAAQLADARKEIDGLKKVRTCTC
jgi:kinesin family protein 22